MTAYFIFQAYMQYKHRTHRSKIILWKLVSAQHNLLILALSFSRTTHYIWDFGAISVQFQFSSNKARIDSRKAGKEKEYRQRSMLGIPPSFL